MQRRLLAIVLISVLMLCFTYANGSEANGILPANLNLIPTAETVGKGGYSLSIGAFHHDLTKKTDGPAKIDAGDVFEQEHEIRLESDIWLLPSRITYGISERLDITFGGTYSTGDTDKIVSDYYETGDNILDRKYSQVVLDGILGMKYVMQPGLFGLPGIAIGGEVQMGYTIDDELTDEDPRDSFQFLATQVYMSASYKIAAINLHGGVGVFASTKTVDTDKSVELPIQAGLEVPFESFAIVLDATLFNVLSGVETENIVSGGLRYNISSRTAISAGFSSNRGVTLRLTLGGSKTLI